MLTKAEVIDLFGSDKPKLNMEEEHIRAYKHALLLATVQTGINMLAIGNPRDYENGIWNLIEEADQRSIC